MEVREGCRARPEAGYEEDFVFCGFEGGEEGGLVEGEAGAEREGEGVGGCAEG